MTGTLPDTLDDAASPVPAAVYRRLREIGTVHRVDDLASLPGGESVVPPMARGKSAFLAVGRDEAERVYRDTEHFSSFNLASSSIAQLVAQEWANDGPEHDRVRKLVSHAFRPRTLERWREDFIGPRAHHIIDGFVADGRADLSRQFAMELPIQVISRILGLPSENYERFRQSSFDIMAILSDTDRAVAARDWVRTQVNAVYDASREEPSDHLISDLANTELDGEQLTKEEVFDAVMLLLIGGNETTFSSLGIVMYVLMTHPDQFELVLADRSLIPAAIQEVLRWFPPAAGGARVAIKPTELGGQQIEEGDWVFISKVSANRDERYWSDPDRFLVARQKSHPHLSFAAGPHFCIGVHLARMELEVGMAALLDRLTGIRIDPGAEPAPRLGATGMGGVNHLPVLFAPGEARH